MTIKNLWATWLKVVEAESRISLVYVLSFNRKAKFVSKRLLFNLFIIQGEESCDVWQLFCTCIRTERVRNMSIFFSFLNKFSCGKV